MNTYQDLIDEHGLAEALRRIRLTHNSEVSSIDLRFANILSQSINELDLSGVNLEHSVWKKVSIKKLTGTDIRLRYANWEEVDIMGGHVTLMIANGIKLSRCTFAHLKIELSEFPRSFWDYVQLRDCCLLTVNLVNGIWRKCVFMDTVLTGIDGRYLDIRPDKIGIGNIFTGKMIWKDSDLCRAKFDLNDLREISIERMTMSRPTLKGDGRFIYSQKIGSVSTRPQRPKAIQRRHRGLLRLVRSPQRTSFLFKKIPRWKSRDGNFMLLCLSFQTNHSRATTPTSTPEPPRMPP